MQSNLSKIGALEGIAVIGFRLDPDSESADIFTLMAYGERDFPIQENGYILFFNNLDLALTVYERFDEEIKRLVRPPRDVNLVCDLAQALRVIEGEDSDPSANVLNCLNTIFDLVTATGLPWPNNYETVLSALADHLTFEHEFSGFLEQRVLRREEILNALVWSIGAITAKAKLIR